MLKKSTAYDPNCRNIRDLVYNAADRYPDRPAFKVKVNGEIVPITFREVIANTEALGTELMAQGYDQCSMGIIGDNSYPWYLYILLLVILCIVFEGFVICNNCKCKWGRCGVVG